MDNYKIKKLSSYPISDSPGGDDLVPGIASNGDGTYRNVNIPCSALKGNTSITDYDQLTNKPDLSLKADKSYVDSRDAILANKVEVGLQNKVNKAGDIITGNLGINTTADTSLNISSTAPNGYHDVLFSNAGSSSGQQNLIFISKNNAGSYKRNLTVQTLQYDRTADRELSVVNFKMLEGGKQYDALSLVGTEVRVSPGGKIAFGAGGVSLLVGTGFPDGGVAASVGSMYTDKSATNGAIRWIKKTGGDSANGWAVDYGDTGWRNITPNPLPTNIDKTDCKIRRVNDVVEVAIGYTNVINANETVYTNSLPLGFRPAQNVFVTGTSTGPGTSRTGGVAIDGARIRWQSTVGNWRTAYARYTTNDPWPTTLPGAAA